MDIRLKSRQIYPAVINLKQYTNGTNTLKFVLDNYMFDEINLNDLDAYAITSIAGLIDETKLTKELVNDKLQLTWQVMNYTSQLAGAVTYQICFKDSAGAVWYSFNAILVISESIPADDHLTANYPSILRQWEDYMANLQDEIIMTKSEALEMVQSQLMEYSSGVIKLEFTDTDERWVETDFGFKITISTENMNLLNVWRTLDDGSNEIIVAGITTSANSVSVESLDKFNGFVSVSTLNSVTANAAIEYTYSKTFVADDFGTRTDGKYELSILESVHGLGANCYLKTIEKTVTDSGLSYLTPAMDAQFLKAANGDIKIVADAAFDGNIIIGAVGVK